MKPDIHNPRVRTHVDLPNDLRQQAFEYAIAQGESFTTVVTRALEHYLKEQAPR